MRVPAKFYKTYKDETFLVKVEPLGEVRPGLYVQLRGTSSDAGTRYYIDIVKEFLAEFNGKCCALVDVEGAKIEMKHSGQFAREMKNELNSPAAMIGLNPVLRVMMDATNRIIGNDIHRPFKTRDEAVKWLQERMLQLHGVAVGVGV